MNFFKFKENLLAIIEEYNRLLLENSNNIEIDEKRLKSLKKVLNKEVVTENIRDLLNIKQYESCF